MTLDILPVENYEFHIGYYHNRSEFQDYQTAFAGTSTSPYKKLIATGLKGIYNVAGYDGCCETGFVQ